LEARLSEALGEAAFHAVGLGAPKDTRHLTEPSTELEQRNLDLQRQLDERADELTAARTANRELMTQLTSSTQPRLGHPGVRMRMSVGDGHGHHDARTTATPDPCSSPDFVSIPPNR
jgi:hypothetical protein